MDLQVRVTHTIDPEVIDLLQKFLNATSDEPQQPAKMEVVSKTEPAPEKKSKKAKAADIESAPETETEAEKELEMEREESKKQEKKAASKSQTGVTRESIRLRAKTLVKESKEKREAVKKLLDSFGVDSVSSLQENQFEAFNDALSEIE